MMLLCRSVGLRVSLGHNFLAVAVTELAIAAMVFCVLIVSLFEFFRRDRGVSKNRKSL